TASIDPAQVAWQTGVSRRPLLRWSQTLQVTLRLMSTNFVIASGSAYRPSHLPGALESGTDTGSWMTVRRMEPGASYRVRVYAPHPNAGQLRSAGTSYPASITATYLSILVPLPGSLPGPPNGSSVEPVPRANVAFPPFGSAAAAGLGPGNPIVSTLRTSPYARAFVLARRLAAGASSPYVYALRIERYLHQGYRYNLHTQAGPYPLERFLFFSKQGYCQHFAGAMALLLRMGGVPARVAVGFTDGSYDTSTRSWLVTDVDAHAWVEAWFPRYGWVRFDPTPSADPALRDLAPESAGSLGSSTRGSRLVLTHRGQASASSPAARHGAHNRHRGSGGAALLIALAILLSLAVALTLLTRARRGQDQVAELARAFARSGRPLGDSATLAAVERRLEPDWPQAAAYVRALRLARFGPGSLPPSLGQRRALRSALAQGLGITGRLRAWWALPPRWSASHRP
ncbi:MAG TPA: transglutaminase-like domain-containing protein, partial [Solirubrobacteraceae bacterium]|nr:transglutaminase-like domain-containing protein [Solirubrobacteraceae bacterium]